MKNLAPDLRAQEWLWNIDKSDAGGHHGEGAQCRAGTGGGSGIGRFIVFITILSVCLVLFHQKHQGLLRQKMQECMAGTKSKATSVKEQRAGHNISLSSNQRESPSLSWRHQNHCPALGDCCAYLMPGLGSHQ